MQAPPDHGHYEPQRPKAKFHWAWILVFVIIICGCGGAGVLGAILFPVFMQAKMAAGRSLCVSNVKQSSLALLMYSADNNDRCPAPDAWITKTSQYVQNDRVFTCPSVKQKGGEFGYAMNSALGSAKETASGL